MRSTHESLKTSAYIDGKSVKGFVVTARNGQIYAATEAMVSRSNILSSKEARELSLILLAAAIEAEEQ